MKIVVIGGTGPVGSKLVEKLCSDGHELLASPDGAQVVVDVANASSRDLLAAESAARVAHHVMLSAIGAERQEEVVKTGPVPYTILRTTPFFESIGDLADSSTDRDTVRVPSVLIQPVAADDVASTLADVALGSPLNDTVELAGPEAFRLDELVRRLLDAIHDGRRVTTDVQVNGRALQPGDDARIASTRFDEWLTSRS